MVYMTEIGFLWSAIVHVCFLSIVGPALAEDEGKCMDPGLCERQLDIVIDDIRQVIIDRLQEETESNLQAAPAAVSSTERLFNDGLLSTEMSTSGVNLLLEHLIHQLDFYEEIDWLYYGDEATGQFLALRRAYPCEILGDCVDRQTSTVNEIYQRPMPSVQEDTIIRLTTTSSPGAIEARTTNRGPNGAEPGDLIYTDSLYDMKQRDWFRFGRDDTPTAPTNWTDPYVFSGGSIGVTVARKVVDSQGNFLGVLAADFEMDFLSRFIREIPTSGNSTIFAVSSTKVLLASNTNTSVTAAGSVVDATDSGNVIIEQATTDLFNKERRFESKASDWNSLSTTPTRGEFTLTDGRKQFFDALGIFSARWIVVVVSTEDDFYTAPINPSLNCVTQTLCREIMESAQKDYRTRLLHFFQIQITDYLGAGVSAVTALDSVYNNGFFHEDLCVTCGPLIWSNSAHKENLRLKIKDTLEVFPEIAWLYLGWTASETVLGYRRNLDSPNQLELWKSCDGEPGCTSGTAFWSDNQTTMVPGSLTPDYTLTNKVWYTLPTNEDLSTDVVGWTEPYQFQASNDIGVTVVKKAAGGDWSKVGQLGVWGADYTLSFLSNFVNNFQVGESTVIYVLDKEDRVIAANRGIPITDGSSKATQSPDTLVQRSSAKVINNRNRGLIISTAVFSTIIENEDEELTLIDTIRVHDPSVAVSFDWTLVLVTPERDLYDIDFGDDDDSLETWVIVVIVIAVVVGVILIGAIAVFLLKSGKKDAAPQGREMEAGDTGEEV